MEELGWVAHGRNFASPQFYRPKPSAGWVPIDTALSPVAGQPGRWRSGANSWQVSFGPADAAGGLQQITVGGVELGFTPLAVAQPGLVPSVSGSTATYPDLWPNVDLVERVTADAVIEDLVLTGPGAAASYTFKLSGATARLNGSGGLDLVAAGQSVGVVAPLSVYTAKHQSAIADVLTRATRRSQGVTADSGAKFTVVGDRVSVSVSPSWLASLPKQAYPVTIDPSFTPTTTDYATQAVAFSDAGGSMSGQAAVGQDSSGATWVGAAYVPFSPAPTTAAGEQPWVPTSAFFFAGCGAGQPCSMTNLFAYGESTQPTSYSSVFSGSSLYISRPASLQSVFYVNFRSWFDQHRAGSWFGFGADGKYFDPNTNRLTPTKLVFPTSAIFVDFTYYQQSPAPTVTSPAAGSVSASATPTLSATTTNTQICAYTNEPTPNSGVSCDLPQDVLYDFKVRTSPYWNAGQTVADSGWIPQPYTTGATSTANGYPITTTDPTWTPPPGALSDGMTYYVEVQTSNSNQNPLAASPAIANNQAIVPPALPLPATKFTVKQGLGAAGPSPTDLVGSPPGQTSTPSAGSPSPGTSPSSETVNLVTGNLALSVGTGSMKTLAGPAGVTLAYNSVKSSSSAGSNYGLTASYYTDPGTHVFPATPVGVQVAPSIDTTGATGTPPVGGIAPYSPFMTRWKGTITLPAGTWQLGGVSSGGMRIYLNGSGTPIYDNWAAGTKGLAFGSTTVSGSQRIEVQNWDPGYGTTVQLWANNVTSPSSPVPVVVGSSWLTPTATGLPPGWSMAATSATWTSVTDLGTQVVAHSPTGATAAFTKNTNGSYSPPAGNTGSLTQVDGQVQLSTSAGYLYRFNTSGQLVSMTTVADDRRPAALRYTYGPASAAAGAPVALTAITDPVSARSITVSYGAATACAAPNTADLLCGISFWDGTSSSFSYNDNNQLAKVVGAGGNTTLIGYDSDNRVVDIRDALANDYLASGGQDVPVCATLDRSCVADTWLTYDSLGRVLGITQPQPAPGLARPRRTYTYLPSATAPGAGTTRVAIAGFYPPGAGASPPGVANTVTYDAQARILSQTDSSGLTSRTAWDNFSRPVISLDGAGEQVSTVYDIDSNVTDTYGPAAAACFDPATIPAGVTVAAPVVGYLPRADAATAAGCGVSVPRTHSGYDEGLKGLADTYFSNGQYAGAASLHGTGNGGAPNSACTGFVNPSGGSSDVNLCGTWPAGTAPAGVSTDASNQWSMTMTGTITIPSSGKWIFCVADSQEFTMSIDGVRVLTNINYGLYGDKHGVTALHCGDSYYGAADAPQPNGDGDALTAGPHKVEIQMLGSPAQTTSYNVSWGRVGATTGTTLVPLSALGPAYGLATTATDPDGKTVATRYTAANLGAEYGLATATTVGAGTSAALTTTTAYETPGIAGSYLRRTKTILPAGNDTTYIYYTGTGGPIAAVCGVTASTPQGGELQTMIDPAPDASGPSRAQQFVYDSAGRAVGRRVGPLNSLASAAWQCTTIDPRGRELSKSWPATSTSPGRTTTHTYSLGGNPLRTSVQDRNGIIASTVDLLGRVVSYTDTTGDTSAVTYNQAGQITSTTGPQGALTNTYDQTSGQLSTVSRDGGLLATATYSPTTQRLTKVTYTNGTTSAIGYDAHGRQNSLVFTKTSDGTLITGNQTTSSLAGRITREMVNINGATLTNPNPAGSTATDYTYDGAGRLATAYIPGAYVTYGYATNPESDGCANPGAGANTNRTAVTTTPTGGAPTTRASCYNTADQLVSTQTGATTSTAYTYDGHGNQTSDNGTTLTYDSADRLASTTKAGTTTTYTFDAVDRIIARTTGTTTTRYTYQGFTDTPAGTLTQQFIALPGGVTLTAQTSGNIWSYPDLHGNNTVTTNNTGVRQGPPATYDPWGHLTPGTTPLNNAAGGANLGAFGAAGKLTDTTTNITIMGARPYNPTQGRFYTVDPIQGGCANPYTYVFGDPLNQQDLTGQAACGWGGVGFLAGVAGVALGGYVAFSARAAAAATTWATNAATVVGGAFTFMDGVDCVRRPNGVSCGNFALGAISTGAGRSVKMFGKEGAALVSATYGTGSAALSLRSGLSSLGCYGSTAGRGLASAASAAGNWFSRVIRR